MPIISKIKNMSKEWLKTFLRTLFRRIAIFTAISLFFVAIIFFLYFMKHADEDGMAMYYKITHPLSNYRIFNYRNWLRPGRVSFVISTNKDYSINLKWMIPDRKFTYYKLERKIEGEDKFKLRALLFRRKNNFTDGKTIPNTIYHYSLKSCNMIRCSIPAYKSIKTFELPPDPPFNLKGFAVSIYEVNLNWDYNLKGAIGFEIEREENGVFKKVGKTESGQTSFTHCPVVPGETYTYMVKALSKHYSSENNPKVSITMPDEERIGDIYPIKMQGRGPLVFNGKEWAMVFSLKTEDEESDKKSKLGKNTEIYFQRLDDEFKPVGDKSRISFDSCMSIRPSLAWNGKEYGVVWSDSRNAKPYCYEGGDSWAPKEVYFARLSAEGKRIGPEVKLLPQNEMVSNPRLFWQKDHYDLFYTGDKDLNYVRLDVNGKILTRPIPAGDSTRLWDMTQAGDHYGITWISSGSLNRKILYFLDFDPESKSDIRPIKLAKDSCEEPACLNLDYQIAPPSILWTGSHYGVCYKNCRTDTVLTLINSKTRQHQTLIAMHMRSYESASKNVEISGVCAARLNGPDPYLQMQSAQCLWNGSEIAVFSTTITGVAANAALACLSPEGKPIDGIKLLPITGDIAWLPLPQFHWHQSYYFTFYEDSLIMINP